MKKAKAATPLLAIMVAFMPALVVASTCYGSVGNGRLEKGVQMPGHGTNFRAYSALGVKLGRTYVHERVQQAVLDAYGSLEKSAPGKVYVYGETGLIRGGPMPPHRTHQSGLSVDFMVPVIDDSGGSIPLPATAQNKFGYGLEFDATGRSGRLRIDFDAMAEHLYQLSLAARNRGVGIRKFIFDPKLTIALLQTKHGPYLRRVLPFMTARPWIRHDEHYHVDFSIPCRSIAEFSK